jgi:DNA-binding response OmpR family regulator
MKVLIVEDEPRLLHLLTAGLRDEGHSVMASADGREGLQLALAGGFDAMVLDVMLPGRTGFEMVQALRSQGVRTPILMLTARDAEADVIRGLDLGADDYMTKPFSFAQLLARLRSITRREAHSRSAVLRMGELALDTAAHQATLAGEAVHLTRREFLLLERLMRNMGQPVSRDALIDAVWGHEKDVESNTLDAFIRLLRQKLDEQPEEESLIQTVRGFGYRMRLSGPGNSAGRRRMRQSAS